MYFDIWQSNNVNKFDHYYTRNFHEIIQLTNDDKQILELNMNYDDLFKQAKKQEEIY